MLFCALPVCPPPTVPSHDHPADCPPGLGTLGFPPRGRQGLRATSRHFPGKSVLGRAWEPGASVGWRRAACGGGVRVVGAPRRSRQCVQDVLCAERSVPSTAPSPPLRSGKSGFRACRAKANNSFLPAPRKRGAADTQTLFVPVETWSSADPARWELARPALHRGRVGEN